MQNTVRISPREQHIWALMTDGMTKKEIAMHLNRSFHTVNQIVRQLYSKLGICKETDLVREWFIYHSFVCRDELKQAIKQKATPVIIFFLSITACQVAFNSPAERVVRQSVSRTASRSNSRRKGVYYV